MTKLQSNDDEHGQTIQIKVRSAFSTPGSRLNSINLLPLSSRALREYQESAVAATGSIDPEIPPNAWGLRAGRATRERSPSVTLESPPVG